MTIANAKDASVSRLLHLSVARAIVAQLVQTVTFLHSQGIIHSDLHLGNILFRLPRKIDKLTPDELYENYGPPHFEPVERLDGKPLIEGVPTKGIAPVWLGTASDRIPLAEAYIFLTDFGESYMPSKMPRYYSHTPPLLAPPELRFLPHEPLSFSADIWALACLIWEILGQRPIFEAFNPSDDWMTKEHVHVLGKLPPEWWERWPTRSEWFDEHGKRLVDQGVKPWEKWFQFCVQKPRRDYGMEEIRDEERESLFTMLRSMMAFRPSERLTAEQVLHSDWIQKWALPELLHSPTVS